MLRTSPEAIAADLAALADHYAAAPARLAQPSASEVRGDVSGWSVAGHAWHHEALTRLILATLHRLTTGRGDDAPVPVETEAILALPRIRRGRLQSPESLHPPADGVDLVVLAETQTRHAAALAALDPAALAATPGTRPHPFFGPIDAAGWVHVAIAHARHHDAIAADILADADAARAGAPSAGAVSAGALAADAASAGAGSAAAAPAGA